MSDMISFREKLKNFYADYDVFIRPVFRFVLALLCLIAINNEIGYMEVLTQIFVVLILAVICAILPINGTVLICAAVIVAHSMALSVETGAFALIVYLLMVLLYFRFVPRDSLAIILVPAAFIFHVPAAVPITLGLIRGPVSAVSMIFGLISWAYVNSLPTQIAPMLQKEDTSLLDVMQAMPQALFSNRIILLIIISVGVILIVSTIRRFVSVHAWESGIFVGAALYLGLELAGSFILGIDIDILPEVLGTAVAVVVCLVIEFFNFSADYSRTEYLEFEDDHNYYNVRVTPKRTSEYMETMEREAPEPSAIPSDDSRFVESEQQNEVSRKFEGINLQSKLEESLKTLNTNQRGRENAPEERTYSGDGMKDDLQDDEPSGDTKVLNLKDGFGKHLK